MKHFKLSLFLCIFPILLSSANAAVRKPVAIESKQQIMLKVRFGEVDRLKANSLSLVGVKNIDTMKKYGAFKSYAEPTLVATVGETAKFFSGGEMPVFKAAGEIEYQDYGIEVSFKPEMVGKKIKVNIDYKLKDFDKNRSNKLPHFIVAETSTSVLLSQGESFMISGIVKENFDLDVTDGLFSNFVNSIKPKTNHSQTEMVLAVTPYFATPVKHEHIKLPTEFFSVDSEVNKLLGDDIIIVD